MRSEEFQRGLRKRIEELIEKAEKAQRDWAESCQLLEAFIVVYEEGELGGPLPDELGSRIALLGYKRKRKQRSQTER